MGSYTSKYDVKEPFIDDFSILDQFIMSQLQQRMISNTMHRCLQQSQENNDPHSNFQLGYIYHHGLGSTQVDLEKAFQYYQLAAEASHPTAMYYLCQLYGSDEKNTSSYVKYMKEKELIAMKVKAYVASAAQDAFYSKAHIDLRETFKVSQAWQEELMKLKNRHLKQVGQASKKNLDEEDLELGKVYNELGYVMLRLNIKGETTVSQDAKTYFEKAAKLGNPAGCWNIGYLMYYHGFGVDKDNDRVKEYFEKAAKQKHPRAELILARNFYDSDEMGNDEAIERAHQLYTSSARYAFASTLYCLGKMYILGKGDIEQDFTLANQYLEQAATSVDYEDGNGRPKALFCLGYMYEKGLGVQIDYDVASHCYASAAKMKFSPSLCRLAKLVEKSKVTMADINVALQLYQTASESEILDGAIYSCYRLGKIYNNPQYTALYNPEKAKSYFLKSQANYMYLSKIHDVKTVCQLYHLGIMYENGYGVMMNVHHAIKFYREAVDISMGTYSISEKHYGEKAKKKHAKLISLQAISVSGAGIDVEESDDDKSSVHENSIHDHSSHEHSSRENSIHQHSSDEKSLTDSRE